MLIAEVDEGAQGVEAEVLLPGRGGQLFVGVGTYFGGVDVDDQWIRLGGPVGRVAVGELVPGPGAQCFIAA